MSTKKELAPHEAWDRLESMALEDEAQRVAALSDAELDDELAKKGFDAKALRERGAALAAKLAAGSAARPDERAQAPRVLDGVRASQAHPRRRWVVSLAAASVAVAAGAVAVPTVVMPLAQRLGIAPPEQVAAEPSAKDRAGELRRGAGVACHEGRWVECSKALDEAKALDPDGEEAAEVKALRRAIAEGSSSRTP